MPGERWIDAVLPFVDASIPPAPARVLDVGCGPDGGFVPSLRLNGYDAEGVDPRAPTSSEYHRIEVERFHPAQPFDAIVASVSLHHVADLDVALDHLRALLRPGGRIVVAEWAWERMDAATLRWSFDRIPPDGHASWLARRRDEWRASGEPCDVSFHAWANREGLHTSQAILEGLDRRFERVVADMGPYLFPVLTVTREDEEAASAAGEIRATATRYVGVRA